jgi:hypothetical protein
VAMCCRRAGLTVLLDLPRCCLVFPPRGRSQAGAPAAAQRRGRTSLTPASGGRSSRARKGRLGVGLSGVVCCFPVRGRRSGLTSTHPAPRQCAGGCHDHVSGTGLLSHVIERGATAGSCRRSELTRGLATLRLTAAAAAGRHRRVPSRTAGARRGSPACGRSRWWRSASLTVWRWPRSWRRSPGTAWRSARLGSWPIAARLGPAWRCARAGLSGPSRARSGSARPSWPACGRLRTG